MKRSHAILASFFTASLLWAQASPPEGSMQGWDQDRLKAEVYRLRREVQELKAKLGYSETTEIKDKGSVKMPKDAWKVDDFEATSPASGIGWWSVEFDKNGMGTTLEPNPYQRSEKGSPLSPGFCAGIKGHFGPNEAPWTWAFLQAPLSSQGKETDLNGFKEVWFAVKGDGQYYIATLRRAIVKDYCHFQSSFVAPERWTHVRIPLARFNQPTWGAQYPRTFPDVKEMAFSPELHEADYDLKVDDIVFVK
jgi:hypothetical protein